MHSDSVSMHVSAHRACRRYGLMFHVLVWHGSHGFAMESWSSSMVESLVSSVVELTCPWPERADMGVPMAACMAVTMGKLSPVPRDEQIALWREHMTSIIHDSRRARRVSR